ncbi:HMG box family protein [Trichomonas vaginalis G3]|uniref:HMG box family protein n=1 Tax=Trichomonas vaginalis (strain ATCC PRA-98 / G3) TaxID=412133 RepID=A2FBH2_TRIV3|nr:HMG-box family [Trichomonas vaginalis G3]EAX97759.1 HMG box family protein [Trichomonas vaginalis G3]KAI5491166.1 HMG-box family [Trichomonas vaginalis G3]|eukprot:XP_001310689.1 HMG box family protein [Trichomonas vaginalis G3]
MNDSNFNQMDAFTLFCYKNREMVMTQNPNLPVLEVNNKLNEMWMNLSDSERMQYTEAAASNNQQKKDQQQQYTYGHTNSQMNGIDLNLMHTPEWPTDPHKYLVWLGAQVLQQLPQFVQDNPDSDIANLVSKIRFNPSKPDNM